MLSSPPTTAATPSAPESASSASASASASRPIPLPPPVVAVLAAIFRRRRLESVFYDSAASDTEEEGGCRPRSTRRRRQPEPAAAAAPVSPPPTIATAAAVQPSGDSAGDLPPAPGSKTATVFAEQDAALVDDDESSRARVRAIRRAILDAGDALRARRPWLEPWQDAIGVALIVGAVAANLAVAAAFASGALGWQATVVTAALAQSILHELEHDLIHACYFAKRFGPRAVNVALALVYSCRLSTINPWARRRLHLNHHNAAGTPPDLEERAITNGMPWGPLRLLVTGDNALAVLLRPVTSLRELRDYVRAMPDADPAVNPSGWLTERARLVTANAGGYLPGGLVHYGLWYAFLADAGLKAAGFAGGAGLLGVAGPAYSLIRTYAAAFGASNLLRTFCLHLVSSNIHYVGIARGDVLNQTQVVTHPASWPFQLFCFCFGVTHAIHHFVVRDTFYMRHAIAPSVLPVMKANGVRFNDFGTFARANRVPDGGAAAFKLA